MWWDSSISIDSCFLELIPTLNSLDLQEFPVSSSKIIKLTNQSVGTMNLSALIGALKLLHIKNQVIHLKKEFEIVHLAYLDRIFYLISEIKMNSQKERLLHYYGRLVFQRWFSVINRQKLQKLLVSLKKSINILQKLSKSYQYQKEQIKQSENILTIFHFQFEDSLTIKDHEEFSYRFKEHIDFIYRNKKQIIFLNFLYEIKYMLVSYLSKNQLYIKLKELCNVISGQLFYLSTTQRLSYSIQNMAFVLNKVFLINKLIDNSTYDDFRNIIASIIEQFQIITKNLQEKTQYFAYHMKQCNYFDYLQEILTTKTKKYEQRLNGWKQKIRKAITLSLQNEQQTKNIDCNQTIFYLQLRPRQVYLYGYTNTINDFPDINSDVVLRLIVSPYIKNIKGSQNICAFYVYLVMNESENDMVQIYKKFNLMEKGIFVYYLIYYKAVKTMILHKEIKQLKQIEIIPNIDRFLNNLPNENILQLINFYLFQIRLGNYYRCEKKDNKFMDNTVNHHLYHQFISLFHRRIKNSLVCYKELKITEDLKSIIILIKCTSLKEKSYCICRNCIKIFNLDNCPYCCQILLRIKLYTDHIIYFSEIDPSLYTNMISQIADHSKSILSQLLSLLDDNPAEWLKMFALVLQEVLNNIDYL